jgi:hypothetical protein
VGWNIVWLPPFRGTFRHLRNRFRDACSWHGSVRARLARDVKFRRGVTPNFSRCQRVGSVETAMSQHSRLKASYPNCCNSILKFSGNIHASIPVVFRRFGIVSNPCFVFIFIHIRVHPVRPVSRINSLLLTYPSSSSAFRLPFSFLQLNLRSISLC